MLTGEAVNGASEKSRTIVILTALPVEYQAVRERLASPWTAPSVSGTVFECGWLDGTPWQIALAELGPGRDVAATITERAIAVFAPRAVVFVGVAGGLKEDVALGDVVVATKVYAVHGGKEENGRFHARPVSWQAPHDLEQLARLTSRTGAWTAGLPRRTGRAGSRPPVVHLAPIASGDVVLNSSESPLREQLRDHYQDAVAIEMESAGMARAAHLNRQLPALAVRGVSDKADGRKYHADRGGSQATAARHAAAFTLSVIRVLECGEGEPEDRPEQNPTGNLRVHRSETPPPALPTAARAASVDWRGGNDISVDGCFWTLHEDHLQEHWSADHTVVRRAALAGLDQQLDPWGSGEREPDRHRTGRRDTGGPVTGQPSRDPLRYAWLRQAEARQDTPAAREAVASLSREDKLLHRLGRRSPGLPNPGRYERLGHDAALLVLPWPASRSGGPCGTLHAAFDSGRPRHVRPWDLNTLLHGAEGLCGALDVLHRAGAAHRYLTPSGIIRLDNERLVLRDLGLAGHDPRPGEGPERYRAPEQWRGGHRPDRIGPPTDVYQLAAVIYDLATGHPPDPGAPLPLRSHLPDVPDSLDRGIRAALGQDPGERPGARALAAALRAARRDLPGEV